MSTTAAAAVVPRVGPAAIAPVLGGVRMPCPLLFPPRLAGAPAARFDGTTDDAAAAAAPAARARVASMLRNRVRKCPGCGKPNGETVADCNGCGASLVSTPVSFTPNVFMGFVLGVARGPFPLTVAVRHEDAAVLVIDDLLASGPLHLNALPGAAHIPDWRHLLRRPAAGLALIRRLYATCECVAVAGCLGSAAWRRGRFPDAAAAGGGTGTTGLPLFDVAAALAPIAAHHGIRTDLAAAQPVPDPPAAAAPSVLAPSPAAESRAPTLFLAGFNYPPSQFQLHLQFMSPLMLPFHTHQARCGVHFTAGRFFPFPYVAALLRAAAAATPAAAGGTGPAGAPGLPAALLADDVPVDAIVAHARDALGVDYDAVFGEWYAAAMPLVERCYGGWDPALFSGRLVPAADPPPPPAGAYPADAKAAELPPLATFEPTEGDGAVPAGPVVEADRAALMSYGRPFGPDGRPTGSFYTFAKAPEDLESW